LSADKTLVAANVLLNDGFRSLGRVNLETASMGGELDCADGTFEQAGDGFVTRVSKPTIRGE